MKYLILSLIMFVASTNAFALSSFSCGKDKNKIEKAEIVFTYSFDAGPTLRVKGENLPADRFQVKPAEEMWIITVYDRNSDPVSKYVFYVLKKSVEEYKFTSNGNQKKVGHDRECVVTRPDESYQENLDKE